MEVIISSKNVIYPQILVLRHRKNFDMNEYIIPYLYSVSNKKNFNMPFEYQQQKCRKKFIVFVEKESCNILNSEIIYSPLIYAINI